VLPLQTVRRWLAKVGLPVALTLAGVVALDRTLGRHEGGGPYRQEIPRPIAEVRRAPTARHIVVGCSTSNWIAKALRKEHKQVTLEDVVSEYVLNQRHQAVRASSSVHDRRRDEEPHAGREAQLDGSSSAMTSL
jgi:hypothetical protein